MTSIEITGVGSELQGVGRLGDGKTVFVPGALEGETVNVRLTRDKGRYCEAELLNVLTPSKDRAVPACPYNGACGGCRAAHMTYEASLRVKRDKVVQTLCRVGGFKSPEVEETVGMPNPFRYRNKAEYAIANGKIGLRPANSRAIIEIEDCLLQSELSVKAMLAARKWLARYGKTLNGWFVTRTNDMGEIMCVLSTFEKPDKLDELRDVLLKCVSGVASVYALRLKSVAASALDGECALVYGKKAIAQNLNGLEFEMGPKSFFQVNAAQAAKLYELSLKSADIDADSAVIDAYCGVGTITLSAARLAKEAIGVECVEQAIFDARENARLNGLEGKTRFIAADAAKEIPRILKGGFKSDVIIVDPPRKGVDAALIDAIIKSGVKRVVYVSCDAATLARDMAKLCSDGAYEMGKVTPVDMFGWTSHIECVTCAVKRL